MKSISSALARPRRGLRAGALVGAAFVGGVLTYVPVRADVLLDESHLLGLPAVASPAEFTFTEPAAEALTVTLTDFQTPAAFGSLQIAVTLGDALIGSGTVDATHTASVAVPAAAGNYVLRVIGTPDATQGIGSFGVCVTRNADPTPRPCVTAYSFSGNLQTPSTASLTGIAALNTNFTSTTAGTYTVTLTDDAFPVALRSLSASIFSGSAQVGGVIAAGTPAQVSLAAGAKYSLLVAGIADSTVLAGLYGVRITDPSGAPVFDRTLPVGKLGASTQLAAGATPFTAVLADEKYPAPLAGVGAAITGGGLPVLAKLTAPGTTTPVTSPTGNIEVWQYASAGAQPGIYDLTLTNAGSVLLAATPVVNPPPATATAFAFIATLPSSGSYNLAVSDFQFPSSLQSLSATVAQNGSVLTQDAAGNFAAAAGKVVVLVNAQPPASGQGIFSVTVKSGAPAQVLLDQTQAVGGGVFNTRTLNFGSTGGYDVTLTDLGFPANFQNLALVVSLGNQALGKIYGGGKFAISANPGQYVLTFVATPSAKNYGLYAVKIASSPPTVILTAGASSVATGQPVQLTWTSQNATSCTSSGATGWNGVAGLNGTQAVIISATSTLTLTCTGPGGSTSQSVSVTATAAPAKSGGGALDWGALAGLAALAGAVMRGRGRQDVAGL